MQSFRRGLLYIDSCLQSRCVICVHPSRIIFHESSLLTHLLAQAADAHKGQVRDFHAPQPPQAPAVPSTSDLSSELEAYTKSEPDVEAAAPASGSSLTESHQTADAWLEEAKKPVVADAHH